MMNNFYTIKKLLNEIHFSLEKSFFLQAYSTQKNTLNLCFYKDNEEYTLVVSFSRGLVVCYLETWVHQPAKNTSFFFESLKSKQINALEQVKDERAFVLHFKSSDSLVLRLFGGTPNVFFLQDGRIRDAYKQKMKWEQKNLDDIFPETPETLVQTATPRQRVLARQPKLPRSFINELIHYQNAEVESTDWEAKADAWAELLANKPVPRLLEDHRFTLFPESVLPLPTKYAFQSVNEGLKKSWSILMNEGRLQEHSAFWKTALEKRIRYLLNLVEQGASKEKKEKQAEQWQRWGHLLMSQPQPERKLKKLLTNDFFTADSSEITIPLNEQLTLLENAQRYYRRSENARKSVQFLGKQAEKAQNDLNELEPVLTILQELSTYQQFLNWQKTNQKILDRFHLKEIKEGDSEGFAQFQVDGYEIWMGKNAKSNDLVLQRSHKEDLWFHARGTGGSHVLIRMNKKKENPPKPIMEKVASLAAWHSQAKGSSLVPVQLCRRKFVRKPKGAAPGFVLVDKEEVMMVKPDNLL